MLRDTAAEFFSDEPLEKNKNRRYLDSELFFNSRFADADDGKSSQ